MWWNVVNIFFGFRTSKSIRKCIKKTPCSFLHADLCYWRSKTRSNSQNPWLLLYLNNECEVLARLHVWIKTRMKVNLFTRLSKTWKNWMYSRFPLNTWQEGALPKQHKLASILLRLMKTNVNYPVVLHTIESYVCAMYQLCTQIHLSSTCLRQIITCIVLHSCISALIIRKKLREIMGGSPGDVSEEPVT